jgi:AcrR family transcriptional regulator
MERARAGILEAALVLVAEGGARAVSMAAVARTGKVAKATVYNHFRDREELLRAVAQQQWELLAAECAAAPSADRLGVAALRVSGSPALAGLRRHDPAVLVHLIEVAVRDPQVGEVVAQWGDLDAESTVRLLASFAVAPSSSPEVAPSGGGAP